MPWRTSPEWSPRPHLGEHGFKSHPGYCNDVSAGHRRAQVAVTHPRPLCRFNSCPTHSSGLVAQPAEQDSLKVEVQGSTPCGATGRLMGVSSNGKTVGLHPADEGSTPSTVHCEWPGGGTGRHAVLRRPCPPRREGSSPSLVTARRCPVLRTQAPALRRLVGQFDSGMGYCGLSRGFRALGLRSPVGRFDSCTTYWISAVPAGNR